MNAIGIDVSKGKSTVAIIRPYGEVVKAPYDVMHTTNELSELANFIKSMEGESRVVMEHTGKYSDPIVQALCEAGIFVCVVNAKLIHDYGGETIRRVKTDSVDALKIASYCLDKWCRLKQRTDTDNTRKILKTYNRQLSQYTKIKTMLKNNLISLIDQVFPTVNELFTSPARPSDGHEKWIDFVLHFWHLDCVSGVKQDTFTKSYMKWCRKNGYNFTAQKAEVIYSVASNYSATLPKDDFTKVLIVSTVNQINSICETISTIKSQMERIAAELPKYNTVLAMHGVGKTLAPQLIAEIGDISNFAKRSSLASFAGIEPPENQSGAYNQHSRCISKQGSPHLRKALFQVMCCVLQLAHSDEPTFQFLDKKRSEGKPYKVYMIAGTNKFLRIYYALVKDCIENYNEVA